MSEIKRIPISFIASDIMPIAVTVIDEPWDGKTISVVGKFRPIIAVIDVPVGETLNAGD
jgi:hypothetical protein